MRILHVSESINPVTGGPVVSVTALALAQARLGHEVSLICYAETGFNEHLRILTESLPEFHRVRVVGVPQTGPIERLLARCARSEIKKLVTDMDVMHVHGVWNPFNIVACQESIAHRCPLVIAPHGMLDPWSLRQRYWKKKVFMEFVWRGLLDSAHFIQALNAAEASLMTPLALRAPINVFGNGVFPAAFEDLPDDSCFRNAYPELGSRPYVLFLSRLHHKKGLDYLIDAYEKVCRQDRCTQLVIAGPDGGMKVQTERWVRERGLQSRVHLVGALYGREKFSALTGARCFCLPSRQEGFSMAIAEALACRVPVVISENCHFPEVAEAGAGIVVPLSAPKIAEALLRCINDMVWHEQACIAAHKLIVTRYNWDAIATDIVKAYSSERVMSN